MSGFTGITVEANVNSPTWVILRRYEEGGVVKVMTVQCSELEGLRKEITRQLRRWRS